jgi:5,6,7,8-tetrahydromethanopterin hydro-lyase
MAWPGILIGEGYEGTGTAAAHVNVVLGERTGPVADAWVNSLATPSAGHTPFMVVARPGLPVKPFTLFVNKATFANSSHAAVTWGAAQAGVAAGVIDAVRDGSIPLSVVDAALLLCAVWVDPGATEAHSDAVFSNNRAAVASALHNAAHELPSTADVLAVGDDIWNPFYTP